MMHKLLTMYSIGPWTSNERISSPRVGFYETNQSFSMSSQFHTQMNLKEPYID